MTYRGHIKNGVAVLDSTVKLPDGTPVQVGVQPLDATFWHGQNIEELARKQNVKPCQNRDELAGEWPDGESVDDFLTLIHRSRV